MPKYFCIIIYIALSVNCSSTKEHTSYRFSNDSFSLHQPTLLRTEGVYVHTFSVKGENNYKFIRFFKNGRCFVSKLFDGKPDSDTLSSINKSQGQRTYYKNRNNDITFESWDGGYARYTYTYARADAGSLSILSFRSRALGAAIQKLPAPVIYTFKEMSFDNESNW